ncbi:MAG TPA: serine/threonine-protein kinase, partial [Steroidobacteraceae bacterium]|nr:serine/threonine-protein kinase [Steroidobacteraceae bacterium]
MSGSDTSDDGEATRVRAPTDYDDQATKTAVKGATKTAIIPERRVSALPQQPVANDNRTMSWDTGTVVKDRFVLKEQIGRGGMGIVFAALDRRKEETRDPNPWVALKILSPEFARHDDALVALQREARKAQTLAHPNVATVFDFDRDGDTVYMTMELLRGKTLSSVVQAARGHGIDRAQAWTIIRDIAAGLAYAHRKGIVHADLKPGNVFLLEDGRAKILDFGIARAASNSASATTTKDTFDAGVLGAYTEAYATEEMMAGVDPHPADDIYALGIIAYELLAGQHPYQRRSSAQARKLGLKPTAPKGLTRREWRVLQRCLSLDRKERPRDAGEFFNQLRGITPLQKSLIGATAALALTAGYFGYTTMIAGGPDIPFAQLPMETQRQ